MKVFVAGGTGAVGRPLVAALREAGHEVTGISRREEGAEALRKQGAEGVVCDALDRDAVVAAVRDAAPDALIHQLTAIPPALNPRNVDKQFALTNRLRTEGTRNLLEAAREASVERIAAQSIAFAYATEGDWVKSEDAPLYSDSPKGFGESLAALQELERLVTEAGGTVLRYGLFYGPGTAYALDGSIAGLVRKRRFPSVGEREARLSFIHVDDAARAAVKAVEAGRAGIYNIVDDEPALAHEWLAEYARLLGAKPPRRVPLWVARLGAGEYGTLLMTELRGATNQKAKAELGWHPTRASWREGFRQELAA